MLGLPANQNSRKTAVKRSLLVLLWWHSPFAASMFLLSKSIRRYPRSRHHIMLSHPRRRKCYLTMLELLVVVGILLVLLSLLLPVLVSGIRRGKEQHGSERLRRGDSRGRLERLDSVARTLMQSHEQNKMQHAKLCAHATTSGAVTLCAPGWRRTIHTPADSGACPL